MTPASRLRALPLASWERDGLKMALRKAGLPMEDVDEPRLLFWRYETLSDVPVGFGGLEIHERDALLRDGGEPRHGNREVVDSRWNQIEDVASLGIGSALFGETRRAVR